MTTRAELAYREGVRALDEQQASLNSLHTRTTAILAAALVSASFLAPRAIDRPLGAAEGFLAVQGGALLLAALACLLGVLWPARWTWTCDPVTIITDPAWTALDDDAAHAELAKHLAAHANKNHVALARRATLFRAAVVFLSAAVGTWIGLSVVTR